MTGKAEVLAILGPTAVGKSALSVAVGRALAAEVISADSMQAYIGMDIGTATPTMAERGGIAHHLVDAWPASHTLTVAEYQQCARVAIEQVRGRGNLAIVVGGSGLYASAVLDDLRFPGTDPVLRSRLEKELQREGSAAMHVRLAARDPAAAAVILPSNGRRIVRALEVNELTGGPFIANLPDPVDQYRTLRIGLAIPRTELDERIAERVDLMWQQGFVDEVKQLAATPGGISPTAARALGYQQILAYLAGTCTQAEARQSTIDATRKFARRQQRWFARDRRIHWVDYDAVDLVEQVTRLFESGQFDAWGCQD